MLEDVMSRLRNGVLLRPAAFIAGGLLLAWSTLTLDTVIGAEAVPVALRYPVGHARPLLVTLAGATLTIAGITFWVRAASVQLASSQYSPRVVHGFLQDWFQQSMMGLLVGFFAYIVSVLRAVPGPEGRAAEITAPHVSILVAIVLAGGSVLAVLVAIRNSVRSMQAADLARRITDETVEQIRRRYPGRGGATVGSLTGAHRRPSGRGHVIKSPDAGWVHGIREEELLAPLPEHSTVRIEVRSGLFVARGRPLVTVWSDATISGAVEQRVREAIKLGRSPSAGHGVHGGLQQLVDVALGSLSHAADTASAYEVIVHIELIMQELMLRPLPPNASEDDAGRWVLRPRVYTFSDYVAEAYDRLRLAAAPHPTTAVALLESIGALVRDLEGLPLEERAEPLRRQGRLVVAACRAHDHVDEDLALIQEIADRYGFSDRRGP